MDVETWPSQPLLLVEPKKTHAKIVSTNLPGPEQNEQLPKTFLRLFHSSRSPNFCDGGKNNPEFLLFVWPSKALDRLTKSDGRGCTFLPWKNFVAEKKRQNLQRRNKQISVRKSAEFSIFLYHL